MVFQCSDAWRVARRCLGNSSSSSEGADPVTQTPVSFSECSLVAFLAPLTLPDFPALHQASSKGMQLRRLAPDPLFEAALHAGPCYALEHPPDATTAGLDLLFGPNAIGARANRHVYGSWVSFRDEAIQTLIDALPHYGGRAFTGFLLRYVDLFEAQSWTGLEQVLAVRGTTPHTVQRTRFAVEMEQGERLANIETTVHVRYDVGPAPWDDEGASIAAVVWFDVRTDDLRVESPHDDLQPLKLWLEDAHLRQKQLLWEALTPDARHTHPGVFFDDDEVRTFDRSGKEDT